MNQSTRSIELLENPPLYPQEGHLWRHRKTGFIYKIIQCDIDPMGQLRHENSSGSIFIYRCLTTGKTAARLMDNWENEVREFEQVFGSPTEHSHAFCEKCWCGGECEGWWACENA